MALLRNGFRRILLLIVIIIGVTLIALNIFLNIKLRGDIPTFIEQFSSESGYQIEVQKIGLDPLFRLQLDDITVVDPTSDTKDVLEIDQVTVKPRLISSLISQKIKLSEIVLNGLSVQSDKDNMNNLIDFIKSKREERKEDEPSLVEFGLIKILNAKFQISSDFSLSCPDFSLEFGDEVPDKGQEIKVQGNIGFLQNELAINGTIVVYSQKTSGDLILQLDKINAAPISSILGGSEELKALSQLSFEISELVEAKGQITINSNKGIYSKSPLAIFNYDLKYDKAKDTANLNFLDFEVSHILKGSFSGDIEKVTDELIFNLTGNTETLNINDFIVKMLGDNKNILSGNLNTKNLKVSGSKTKDDIRLSGDVILSGFKFNSEKEDTPSVNNLDCELDFKQNLNVSSSFSFSSLGKCSVEEFFWDKTGEVKDITARADISSKNKWTDNKITLSALTSKYMDGSVTGSLNFILASGFAGGITKVSGNLEGQNLNLKKIPKTIIPVNMEGDAQTATAKFEGGSSNYKAFISLNLKDFVLKSNKGREIKISQVKTSNLIDFEYVSQDIKMGESRTSTKDKIIINGKGLKYKALSFEEYFIDRGNVEDLAFLLDLGEDRWKLNMSSEGSDFSVLGHEISLEQFKESLSIENSGREGFKGKVYGTNGRYKSVDFPSLSWDYNFINDRIVVSNVSTQVSTLGEFKTDNLYIHMGEQVGGYPYRIEFDDASFIGFEDKLKSEGIHGNFIINRPESSDQEWDGTVTIKKTSILSAVIDNISNNITPSPGGINLQNITGEFLGGEISGKVIIDTTKSPSGIDADLKLLHASIDSDGLSIKLNESDLHFSGTLPDDSLPEGTGSLEFKNLSIEKEGVTSTLQANIKTRAVAETLYIEQGFITSNSNQEIGFSGEMDNSLNENRTLKINFPEVDVSQTMGVLSPFVPEEFRKAKINGYAGLDLIFHNLFYPESRWSGKLSLRNGSFAGDYDGALLSIKDINGTITIKDEVSSENPLASLMGEHLKLSKSVFKKFLRSFKEVDLEKDLDFLNIKKVEYGILKFEDVEVALEVDRQKLNLRRLISKSFRGNLYGAGLLKFNESQSEYNLSLLFNEISLEGISERISPTHEYITGRVNGLIWLTGEGAELDTIDGPFKFWSKKSSKESRKIGKALLDKLGAKERLILGSNRSYDNGNISGYINDGLITFKEFDISNSILGIKNLSIQADPVKNSITIAHLMSVVREIARRSETGGPTIETN